MILVTGGAGYIGSHVTRELINQGYEVIVLDNLSTGHQSAIDRRAVFKLGDIGDRQTLDDLFNQYDIKAVMHFAANCLVGESVQNPLKYYDNNVGKTTRLIQSMVENNVKKLIFSSTCAIYGNPEQDIITEQIPKKPINPYGRSKLMIETILSDTLKSDELSYISLRYFNAAGAYPSGEIGEDHDPETHLIPNILKHLQGAVENIEVFGNDYDTPDGTCIRDYIHVQDLTNAHILALKHLLSQPKIGFQYNLGNGKGYSVKEVIGECERITNKKAKVRYAPRRPGDPPVLVASSSKIKNELGWFPVYTLTDSVRSAWQWHIKHPHGYQ
ncbi:UDP-glucose 4-epimerase GalE [Sporolactobacillus shoreae]|uniref:UDP-glucose 4-epimerase n=1 Tax=Sporolactobacillus shoreae TaxID=1465501 RepID=A0A4Z0GRB1_9BACL|nr:UDP-glucose 4-epimerase GalE [Sporolactobacillus shoreae]TGA98712.1 UDP-glucose 4-epimerase GalE [Sporolactobacillus shoreae]